MCGIAGKISLLDKEVYPHEIEEMNEAIKHRGPDDGGVYISPDRKVGLGHRRLSIIDLSPLGHQPMRYKDRYEIVFNGEVYNFQEKRSILEDEGYVFQSHSDTEVILALYDKYREKCLEHLRGMFAFAIYDEREQTLFCARDRVGKKPFKYYMNDQVFMFASELKAILTQTEYKREPDYEAIHHYLTFQYVPAPLTGFMGIQKLEASHYLILDLKTKKLIKERYWTLDYSEKLHLSEEEWKRRILEKLEESVKLRMISDVPIGAFLSGGIDSSAIVALMAKNSSKPIKTFSIGFKEEKYNELPYARMIAEKFGTDHTEFTVEPHAIEDLPMLVQQYEEPYADSSALPTYYVSKLTRKQVTVALNGDGGDENFGGYNSYQIYMWSLLYDMVIPFHTPLILPITKLLASLFPFEFFLKLNRFSESLAESHERRFLHYMCHFDTQMKRGLYTKSFWDKMRSCDSFDLFAHRVREARGKDPMDRIFHADLNTYLPDDLMVKVDIASMANSLEGRSPFLDQELMALTCKIPSKLKIKGIDQKKYILKKALEPILPHEILYRPKRGFGVPLDSWFRGELKAYVKDILLSEQALDRGIFERKALEAFLDNHFQKKTNHGTRIWNLLVLELWFREFFP